MKLTKEGQITIPEEVRRQLGWEVGTEVTLEVEGRSIRLVESEAERRRRVREAIESVAGSATTGLTTDEIMAMTRGDD